MPYSAPVEGAFAGLDIPPPARLAVGRGNAFALAGHCHHRWARIRRLEIAVGGLRTQVDRYGMPRNDVYEEAHAAGTAPAMAFHSGFVATPVVPAVAEPQNLAVEAGVTPPPGRGGGIPLAAPQAPPGGPRPPRTPPGAVPAATGPPGGGLLAAS